MKVAFLGCCRRYVHYPTRSLARQFNGCPRTVALGHNVVGFRDLSARVKAHCQRISA
jgi:hypothetical protein